MPQHAHRVWELIRVRADPFVWWSGCVAGARVIQWASAPPGALGYLIGGARGPTGDVSYVNRIRLTENPLCWVSSPDKASRTVNIILRHENALQSASRRRKPLFVVVCCNSTWNNAVITRTWLDLFTSNAILQCTASLLWDNVRCELPVHSSSAVVQVSQTTLAVRAREEL